MTQFAAHHKIVTQIKRKTRKGNLDNISRTVIYQQFYQNFPEIQWAFLAALVSRNAGWNMTDLKSKWFQNMLSLRIRSQLFAIYERANWLIFEDAYPQLLIYQASRRLQKPLFSLLPQFGVSAFMVQEWQRFWKMGEIERLCTALIINEQQMLQKRLLVHRFFSAARV